MQIRTVIIWSLINEKSHDSIDDEEMVIKALMPLVSALFPGINYYSVTGFALVMAECVIPALEKKHPKLIGMSGKDMDPKAMTEITEILPSKGYEWQNSPEWKAKFKSILEAA